jgi:glyoxylase-like metal-dependent hydrolase (beta-lactamase superfamily II)
MRTPCLEPVARGVWLLRGGLTRTMNVYLLEEDGGVVVFDTGEKGMAPKILAAAQRMGGLRRVVLGHADTDHRGSAPALSAHAPVLCHPDAVAEAEGSGGRSYWDMRRLPPAIRLLHRFAHRFVWDGGPVQISGTVSEGDRVAGFEVVELDGHAPGMIGLWRAEDRVALVSDTVYVTTMLGRPTAAHVPHPAYNLDLERARRSVRRLAELDPLIVGVGHLGPMEGQGVRAELERAAAPAAS